MSKLYTNSRGDDVVRHSYSSNATWEKCSRMYQLEKIRGLRRKDKSAAMAFGKAFEDGVQFYHDNGLKSESGQDEFRRIWLKHKENTEFVYTSKEKDWANLRDCGVQLLRLYEIILPKLPIKDPTWQLSYTKNVFPGTTLSDLEFGGFIDLLVRPDWDHPLLPKIPRTRDQMTRPLIIDLKTSGVDLNVSPDMLALDPQLQVYSWLTGVEDVAFLWAVKSVADAFQKGTEITLLQDSGKWTAGDKAVIYEFDSESNSALITHEVNMFSIKEELAQIKGKGSTEAKAAKIEGYIKEDILSRVPAEIITKQKIQFLATRISPENMKEAGDIIAKQMVDIHNANETGFYPKRSGVRFPNNGCTYCAWRGECTGNKELSAQLLVQITNPTESDWLDEINEDEG